MNELHAHQRAVLERGLVEFDSVVRRRHVRRRVLKIATASAAVLAIALIAVRFGATPRASDGSIRFAGRALPSYVEVIRDDEHLSIELELASACERIGRNAGRVYVVECAHPRGAGPGSGGNTVR